jgi:hypothetical protein
MPRKQRPIFRPVLQKPNRTQELAAWELLDAVERLYKPAIEELTDIERHVELPHHDWTEDEDADTIDGRVWAFIEAWAIKHHIHCQPVIVAARHRAFGNRSPERRILSARKNHAGDLKLPPTLSVDPYEESPQEFLVRAKRYYRQVERFVGERAPAGAAFREATAFLWLVANRVGGKSWADIANGRTDFPLDLLPIRAESTVSGEARKLARLLGIEMPSERGPRPGKARSKRSMTLRSRK